MTPRVRVMQRAQSMPCPQCGGRARVTDVRHDETGARERRLQCVSMSCRHSFSTVEIVVDGRAQGKLRAAARAFVEEADRQLPRMRQLAAELNALSEAARAVLRTRADASSKEGVPS